MSHAVTVAVRCRPLSPKEVKEKANSIITMSGQQTTICDPRDKIKPLNFVFDHSFWSSNLSDPNFASQEIVFDNIGKTLVSNAFLGYNGCLFAYGQTGSGKTYSMMGYGEDKGVIPRLCNELFDRCEEETAGRGGQWTFQAQVSYLEIYNEKCRCLLAPNGGKGMEFRVREHPTMGPYVENLSKVVVNNFDDIERLMDQGNKTRTVAATAMNATSSRSHAIFTVTFTQRTQLADAAEKGEVCSKINLVDLAGSERADRTEATGDTLKEGSNINKSLTTLAKVISALAEGTGKDGKFKKHVPFRDSSLTWLLKENLCGNSKTIMLAALSPAGSNYDETVSTLRYADRAKNLRTAAVKNEDPGAKKVRELTEEVDRLRAMLEANASPRQSVNLDQDPLEATLTLKSEYEMMSTREKLEMVNQLLAEENLSWEEQAKASANVVPLSVQVNKTYPSLVNLNEDPLMSECLAYYAHPGDTHVGSSEELDKRRDIFLDGRDIKPLHATINFHLPISIDSDSDAGDETDDSQRSPRYQDGPGKTTISTDAEEGGTVLVNGVKVVGSVELKQGDRVIFGNYHVFRFSDPRAAAEKRQQMATFGSSSNLHSHVSHGSAGFAVKDSTMDYQRAMEERFEAERAAWLASQPAVVEEDDHKKEVAAQQMKLDIMQRRIVEMEEKSKKQHGLQSLQTTVASTREQEASANAQSPLTAMMQLSGNKANKLPPKQIFRYKIILLGHQEVGKTSLRKCFQSDPLFFKKLPDVQSTTGIEVQNKSIKVGSDTMELSISDFAGQEAYHSHTLFLTDRSLFVLVWKISAVEQDFKSKGISGHEEERLCRWLDEIYAKYPTASIAVCATHLDELRDQSQRGVEFILGKVEVMMRNYIKKILVHDDKGNPLLPNILGNFAVSCKNRTFIAAGQYKNLSGQKMSSLLNVLAWEAHRRCINDEVFWGGAIPGRHCKLMSDMQEMKKDKEKMLLPLGEFVHMAVRCGIESDEELLQVSQLMHSWDVFHMFQRCNVSNNMFLFLHPGWMCTMAGTLFSFAHVLDTPYHLRSIIGGLEYTVTAAEHADMGLLKVGWLRMPLVRILFKSALSKFLGVKDPEDHEYELCVQLLSGLELLYRVDVPCEDDDIYREESCSAVMRSQSGGVRQASPPAQASAGPSPDGVRNTKKIRTVPRYFVPSLSPYTVPPELRAIAPLLFNRGVHVRFDFNMLPTELWWRLQYKLQSWILPVAIMVPKEEEEMEYVLNEACETHNRWKDGMWLSSRYARVLVLREGAHSIRIFSAESRPKGSDDLLRAIEEALGDLLAEYKGVQRKTMVCCPVQGCLGWHNVDAMQNLAKYPSDYDLDDGPVEKVLGCTSCGESFPLSAVVVSGTSPLGPQTFPATSTRALLDLLQASLEENTVVDLCDFYGIRTERMLLSHSTEARNFELDFAGCLDKIVHVTMMQMTIMQAKLKGMEEPQGW